MKQKLIIIDDEPKAGQLMARYLDDSYDCLIFIDPVEAMDYFSREGADLVITDMQMPRLSGAEVLAQIREVNQLIPVIVITAYSNVDNAIEALRLGATDFVKKPFDIEELKIIIDKALNISSLKAENSRLKERIKAQEAQDDRYRLIGTGGNMQKVYDIINKIADIRCNVIIEGESGTGKELVARAIHFQSQSADKPFIVIDCGALTDSLLQSELFGYEKGAFTGANKQKKGLLETASGGTLFLDEICNISDNMQTKLLRVVQEQQITRVGGLEAIDIDVRFVVATNQPMDKMIQEGQFRHDLYHRLNVINIQVPPLHSRLEDIPLLTEVMIKRFAEKYKRNITGFDKSSAQLLKTYHWPGNVRELSNIIERAVALSDNETLHLDEIPTSVQAPGQNDSSAIDSDQPTLAELEKRYIFKLLDTNSDNREKTASILGINKSTLWRKLKEYNV
ncbi:MAG: sigma-54 dependent transcriptional regulator [gamma proteobacterium symbiont of Bathyaustriella thionipta]|nr:sigma-54 dependent transcriptional regulator [gamma proteobacterium symbiont of Bathyaustriella thionipta]MCU7950405.1 sigma-54 dependent transcriptional regulator [gamma proteobacterium symbiont of Bathyaustriella thionipta]MCU7953656.1 sigma-54 dependent transcriptional regulator [gamma proteobacterium symbiont of Bathyaustriella thionipta]MCU7956907.1 sigma-54 dependent transcriptional regulator [gamma proteobacterium symbiont of Bathyaustriella thionipta]MCU7968168.1 sigma-54 dependent t